MILDFCSTKANFLDVIVYLAINLFLIWFWSVSKESDMFNHALSNSLTRKLSSNITRSTRVSGPLMPSPSLLRSVSLGLLQIMYHQFCEGMSEWWEIIIFPIQCVPKGENYFSQLFPKIAALALSLPDQVKTVWNSFSIQWLHSSLLLVILKCVSIFSGHPTASEGTHCSHHSVASSDILPAG